MPGAARGSSAVPPVKVCPLVTVSRLVPRPAISASSAAWEEAARPSTATIAATPIAMPSADSPARSLRVRSPTLASPARSAGRSRAAAAAAGAGGGGHDGPSVRAAVRAVAGLRGGAGVSDDVPVEHLDAAPHPGGDRVVVGDHDDRGPGGVEFLQQGQDRRRRWRSRGCRWARRPAPPAGGPRSPGRSRPAAARPRTAGSAGRRPGARARPGPARRPPAAAARSRRTPAYSSPSATLPSTDWCSARKNCWNTNPIRDARSADSSRSVIRATSRPVTRTVPLVGRSRVPIRCSSVDLPDPDGPTIATSSPAVTVRLTPASARSGGDPGYTLVTWSSSSTGAAPPGRGRPGASAPARRRS